MLVTSQESNLGMFGGVEFKVQHYDYSAFGKILAIKDGNGNDVTDAPLIDQSFTYTGREFDKESGLYYYRARFYDPNIGRFLQVDPDAGILSNPITHINKYIYAGNNPINLIDPSGKDFWGDTWDSAHSLTKDFVNRSIQFVSKGLTKIVESQKLQLAIVVVGGAALMVYGGPVGFGAGAGMIIGGVNSYKKKSNVFDGAIRWGLVGAAAGASGGLAGSVMGQGLTGVVFGAAAGSASGFVVGDLVGVNRDKAAIFGAGIGGGAATFIPEVPPPISSNFKFGAQ
jgi:RHS repeat-associated protein